MIENQVKKTLRKTGVNKKEKILVAVSGGKDSAVTAYLLSKFGYNIRGFHIDLKIGDYSEKCKNAVVELCRQLGISLIIYDIKKEMGSGMCYLRSAVQSRKKTEIKNCAICGVIKKWIFNKEARKLKADKIATGHNLDDESQTFLMNLFKGSPELSANIGVITENTSNKKFIPRIKPLFYIAEEDIRKYSRQKKLPVVYEKCPCALDSYRIQVREFTEKLSEKEKINVVRNFERLREKFRKKESEINYCRVCGEPSRNQVCRKCGLMQ